MGPEESGTTTSQITDSRAGVRDGKEKVGEDGGTPRDEGVSRASDQKFLDLHLNGATQVIIRNLVITQLAPEALHEYWPYLKRGAEDILRKVGKHTDWIVEDLYAALRYPEASHTVLWLVSRNAKQVGWAAGNLERTKYGQLEFFVWDGWTIPLREREPEDDVDGARIQLFDFIKAWAKNQGCKRLTCLSPRPLEKIGWEKGCTSFSMPL